MHFKSGILKANFEANDIYVISFSASKINLDLFQAYKS